MRASKLILGLAVFLLVSTAGWQICASELANIKLREDMQDLASQSGSWIGLTAPGSDEYLRNAVVDKARQYDIKLTPDQITLERTGAGVTGTIYIAADYSASIDIPGFSFTLHFTPASGKKTK